MALLTAPFPTGPQGGMFNDVAQLASLFQHQQQAAQSQLDETAKNAARQQQVTEEARQAVLDGAMQELRRAAALKEKRAFDEANLKFKTDQAASNLSFKTTEADRSFGLKDREMKLKEGDNAPFQLGPMPGYPAAGVGIPASNPGTVSGSGFGLVPDGQGGWMKDPQDNGIGATGINTADPERRGVALSLDQLQASGIHKKADWDKYRVELFNPKTGMKSFEPIVDILGTPGRVDLAPATYKMFGGPDEKGGGLIPGLQFKVVPTSGATADTQPSADRPQVSAASKAIESTRTQIQDMQAMGIPVTVKDARALALANAKTGERVEARASAPQPVKANLQDESGNLYTQFRDGSWKDGRAPEPGSKVFTIGAPGRPAMDGGALTYHDDGTVTTARGKVFHYEDNVLVPAHVPKGATAKQTLAGDDGEYYTQFSNGAWNTDDGQPPEGVKLTKLPGATEEARLDLKTVTQQATEKQRAVAALRSDRDHFDKLANDSQKALDKTAAELSKTPVVWPWQENGKWYKMVGTSKTSMPDAAAIALIADNKRKEALIAEHSAKVAEYTKRSDEADKKLESFVRGETPQAAPAPGSAQPGATAGKPLDKATAAQLVQEAGGDKEKARALARERGYTF